MKIERYGGGGFEANCYLVISEDGEHALLIDPSIDTTAVLARRGSLPKIDAILLTHAHFDHMLQADEWRDKTGAPLAVHSADAPSLAPSEANVYHLFTGAPGGVAPAEILLQEGARVSCGEEGLTVLSTPGHTPGSICLIGDGFLLSGDTLFAGGVGRTDLPGGSPEALAASLHRLFSLEGEYTVYPGHGPATRLSRERLYHPYFEME